ncbi:MAG: galE [Nocardia sp.]|uniref:NAD-dependent epimerase/dehydratase family protein n=1 Tax=Nocardia sp. TaxID=1821 RepID=UPI00260A32F2|nr:NAD-dependent epimerase/dehydratase family protein [Nocardia sp.]MCU1642793.1 galE [Nocardia sp.]
MKLLVTGGAGVVGTTVARMLLDAGHEVGVIADLSRNDGGQTPAEILTPGAGFEAVFHFAGLVTGAESMAHPEWRWDNSTRAELALLDAMAEAEVSKLVFSSICTGYEANKLAIDSAIAAYCRVGGLGAISLRYFDFDSDCPADDTGPHDYLDLTDLARAHLLALDTIQPGVQEIYNLGTVRCTPETVDISEIVSGAWELPQLTAEQSIG